MNIHPQTLASLHAFLEEVGTGLRVGHARLTPYTMSAPAFLRLQRLVEEIDDENDPVREGKR